MTWQPPPTVTLLWCPECGKNDRWTDLKKGFGRHYAGGSRCPGEPVELDYRLPAAAAPVSYHDGSTFRAAVAVEVAVRPGLPHLPGGRISFVGRTVLYTANTVEEVAELSGLVLQDIADVLPDSVAAHPRPAPNGWDNDLHASMGWRHGH